MGRTKIDLNDHPSSIIKTDFSYLSVDSKNTKHQKYQAHQLLCMINRILSYRRAETWEKENDTQTSWSFQSMGLVVYPKQPLYLLR